MAHDTGSPSKTPGSKEVDDSTAGGCACGGSGGCACGRNVERLSETDRSGNSSQLVGLLIELNDRLKVVEQKLMGSEREREWLQKTCTHFTGMLTNEGVICATCGKRLTYGED